MPRFVRRCWQPACPPVNRSFQVIKPGLGLDVVEAAGRQAISRRELRKTVDGVVAGLGAEDRAKLELLGSDLADRLAPTLTVLPFTTHGGWLTLVLT